MMIVDIRKLNAKRQYFGTEQFEYLPDENLLDIPFAAFALKVRSCPRYPRQSLRKPKLPPSTF
jgi:hypothetical protein